ncbi:hypothetical protein JOB18_033549 [Solea senegalensis]|uniref:Uncharacterized protein n=1 Tax=Solea senegalensis TaxID=28829 RepID=A0AAV6R283_SOLSE|nr:hypothetical protein JOB18_033549 [Solea senegalensis]
MSGHARNKGFTYDSASEPLLRCEEQTHSCAALNIQLNLTLVLVVNTSRLAVTANGQSLHERNAQELFASVHEL